MVFFLSDIPIYKPDRFVRYISITDKINNVQSKKGTKDKTDNSD